MQVDQTAGGRTVVKLYDLALAAVASNKLHGVCGCPSYMAPEMIRGTGYERRSLRVSQPCSESYPETQHHHAFIQLSNAV